MPSGRHAARDAGLAVGAHRDHTVARRVPQQELSGMHAVVSHPPAHPSAHRAHRAACRAGCSAVGKACQHPLDLRFSREHPPSLLILLSQYGTGGCSGAWFLGRQVQTAVPFAIEPPEPQLGFLCATPTNTQRPADMTACQATRRRTRGALHTLRCTLGARRPPARCAMPVWAASRWAKQSAPSRAY